MSLCITPWAAGDLQMFPRQTNKTFIFIMSAKVQNFSQSSKREKDLVFFMNSAF